MTPRGSISSVLRQDAAANSQRPATLALAYWVEQLRGAPVLLELPTDQQRPAQQDGRNASLAVTLDDALGQALRALATRHGATLFVPLLAGWGVLLARLSGAQDLVIGTASFGNPLALRVDLSDAPTVTELLVKLRSMMLGALANSDVPVERVIDALGVAHSAAHSPLFQVMFGLQARHGSVRPAEGAPDAGRRGAPFDLVLDLHDRGETIEGTLTYATALFERATIERHIGHWTTLLRAMTEGDDVEVARLPLLGTAERARIVRDWNATTTPFPADRCIHELFEQQVARSPQACALSFEGGEQSYAELNARANRLAHHLVALGVRPDARVAIALPRGPEMVMAVLATLKAGGAYVPMDLAYPADRLAYMLEDSAPAVLITRRDVRPSALIAPPGTALVELDAERHPGADGAHTDLDPARLGLRPSHLAYVIYTSGSTGRPKGVMIEHGGLCSLAVAQIAGFDVRSDSRVLQYASFSFDACISEIVMALCGGAALCLPRPGPLLGRDLLEWLERQRITHATLVPSVLATLPEHAPLPLLRVLTVAGEAVGRDLVQRWAPGRRLINAYGPTETTVCASMQDCDPQQPGSPGIGWPIANTSLYLLDALGEPVPVGVAGELFIGGVGVARGYLNRPELSQERFVADPFAAAAGHADARMFKTGDLGRWRPDGTIEFLGRNDHQVKIRGLRIELGEIEAAIAAHPAVRQVAVLGREDAGQGKRLVAYLVSDADPDGLVSALRLQLRDTLPGYMIPSRFVVIDRMPMTPNGKLDRNALPAPPPDDAGDAGRTAMTAPRNATEQAVWALWREVLKTRNFGVLESFFDAGGDSLLAVQLHMRLEAHFSKKLSFSLVLEAPTVALQSALLEGPSARRDSLVHIRPGTGEHALFLVHDGFGEVLAYRTLAHLLRPGLPVYGLTPVGANGIAMVHTRIRDIAAGYVARIRLVQPQGPYLLGGLCAGGVIAHEMARQLQRAGESIGMLALMDASDVAARKRTGQFALNQIGQFSGAFRRSLSLSDPLGSVAGLCRFAARMLLLVKRQITVRVAYLRAHLQATVLRRCLDRGRPPPDFVRSLSVDEIYAFAEAGHTVDNPVEGDLVLFRASVGNGDSGDEPFKNMYTDPLLGWGQRVSGTVHCVDIDGGHYSMLQEPHVRALAQQIQRRIDALRSPR